MCCRIFCGRDAVNFFLRRKDCSALLSIVQHMLLQVRYLTWDYLTLADFVERDKIRGGSNKTYRCLQWWCTWTGMRNSSFSLHSSTGWKVVNRGGGILDNDTEETFFFYLLNSLPFVVVLVVVIDCLTVEHTQQTHSYSSQLYALYSTAVYSTHTAVCEWGGLLSAAGGGSRDFRQCRLFPIHQKHPFCREKCDF